MIRLFTLLNILIGVSYFAMAEAETTARVQIPVLFSDFESTFQANTIEKTPGFCCLQRSNEQVSDPFDISVTTTRAGDLVDLLGENWTQIETLHVEGPINNEDFSAMWSCAFDGHLKVLDLGKASVEDGVIPDYALFHTDVQVDWDAGVIYTIGLQKLVLPCNTVEIGRHAFAYATRLTEIQFPETLKIIGIASFTNCTRLATDPFILPPNLDVMGYQAFYECFSLAGEVILPPSLRLIDGGAFYHVPINKINIPESVEYLGDFAFYGTKLEEIDLPDNCDIDVRGAQFYGCFDLRRVHLPVTCSYIPDDIFSNCISLEEVNLPPVITHIGMNAFDVCFSLNCFSTLVLPEGLLAIGRQSFANVPIKELHLPSTVNYLGSEAFYWCNDIQSIYCQAVDVPECEVWDLSPDRGPFYGVPSDIDVYIPIDTKTAYSSAFGWNYFTNFIETDEFPFAGVESITIGTLLPENHIYDIYGRIVQKPVPGSLYIRNGKKFIYHN